MSSLFRSTTIRGNRITDFGSTSAEVGVPIPFGYGRVVSSGNIIFAPMPPVENRQVRRQGKGGVKQETYTYTLSYAVAFLQGPCYGFWWIKRNGKIVYTQDPNAPLADQEYSAKWAERVSFYYGVPEQLPDAVIESYEGVGNVSAFKQLAYIVVEDEDVTENGGAPPSYEACIIASPPEVYLTSKVFPQNFVESFDTSAYVSDVTLFDLLKEARQEEEQSQSLRFDGGALVVNTPNQFAEEMSHEFSFTNGKLRVVDNGYEVNEQSHEFTFSGAQLAVVPVGDFDPDDMDHEISFTGGSLWVP